MADETTSNPAAPQPEPDESFLHSLATSLGIDPEAVVQTAKALRANPGQMAKEIGSEAASEIAGAISHPLDTAKQALEGTAAQITNPEAQKTASARFKKAGLGNHLAGAEEYLTSGLPLVGSGLVKSEEQAAKGNVSGSLGTLTGVVAPLVTDTEPIQDLKTHMVETGKNFVQGAKEGIQHAAEATAPEGSLEAGFAKIGGKKVKEPTTAPQGGHAGGGVASEEELNRPGRFVKVSRSGQLTDQGKTPDFNLRPGEVGYQVKPDGTVTKIDGQENPAHQQAIQRYANEVYPKPKPEFEQTLAKRGQLPNQKVNLSDAYGDTGKYVGNLNEAPIKFSTDSLGIKWAENPDGVRVSIPKNVTDTDVAAYAHQKIGEQAQAQAAVKSKVADASSKNIPELKEITPIKLKTITPLKLKTVTKSEPSGPSIPIKLRQTAAHADNMNDPTTRSTAARHEAAHSVISEALNPGSVNMTGLTASGGITEIQPPAGKQTVDQLTPDEVRDMIATSYAGGLSEPGGTTIRHSSGDQAARAQVLAGRGNDQFLKAPEYQAEARARVNALLVDPVVQKNIEKVAAHLATKGKLTGDEVRAILAEAQK